jgi:Winged helix-turn helix
VDQHSRAFIGIDTSKLRNAVAVAEEGRKVVARLECSLQPDVGDSTSTGMLEEVDIRYVVTSLKGTAQHCGDEEIARTVAVGGSTVYRTKRRFVEGNLERALSEDPRPGAERKLTGKEEALLVATACATPPRGAPAGRWNFWPTPPSIG